MKNIVYAKAQHHKHCNLIHIFSKNDKLNIDIQMTLPTDIKEENKVVLLSALTVLEPLCRCNEHFRLVLEFDANDVLSSNGKQKIDESIKMYAELKWVKTNIEYSTGQFDVEDNDCYFSNKNTIEIYSDKLASIYALEVSKTLPYALYERMRSECDYAWRCSECPEGQSGNCEAIVYEEYALMKTKN